MRAPPCSSDAVELLGNAVLENPYPFFARLREEHALSRVGETGIHLVATWEGIIEALAREEDFSANLTGVLIRDEQGQPATFEFPERSGSHVIATADEPDHAVHRRLVRPSLVEKRVRALEPLIRSWTREALVPWMAGAGFDFVSVAETIPARVIGHLLGLPDQDVGRHRLWAMMGGEMLAGDVDLSRMVALGTETSRMARYLSQHLKKAQTDSGVAPSETSLLALLADGVGRGEIDEDEAAGIAIVMFGAGGESTSALIGSSMRILAADSGLAGRLRQEPSLIPRFVEEVVRLEPPFKFHYRLVRRPCEFMGFELFPGDRLMLLWASANRDPQVFKQPNELRLDRHHPRHHMSFGRGAHFCVGAHLARLEARVVVEEVLNETEHLSLVPEAPPIHAPSIFVRRLAKLPVRFVSAGGGAPAGHVGPG